MELHVGLLDRLQASTPISRPLLTMFYVCRLQIIISTLLGDVTVCGMYISLVVQLSYAIASDVFKIML